MVATGVALAIAVVAPASASACSISYAPQVGSQGGWDNPDNWVDPQSPDSKRVPNSGDFVCINDNNQLDVPHGATLAGISVNQVVVFYGSLNIAGEDGTGVFDAGALGHNAGIHVRTPEGEAPSNATIGGSFKLVGGDVNHPAVLSADGELKLDGHVTARGSTRLSGGVSAQSIGGRPVTVSGIGSLTVFSGHTEVGGALKNEGSVAVQTGELEVGCGGGCGWGPATTSTGQFSIGPSARLEYAGTGVESTFAAGSGITGAGTFAATGTGRAKVLGTYAVDRTEVGDDAFNAGTLDFGVPTTLKRLLLEPGGSLEGSGHVTVTELLDWRGGGHRGSGTTTVAEEAKMCLSDLAPSGSDPGGGGTKEVHRTVRNLGRAYWDTRQLGCPTSSDPYAPPPEPEADAWALYIGDEGRFVNAGRLELNAPSVVVADGNGTGRFENASDGLMVTAPDLAGNVDVNTTFANSGTVHVPSGSLRLLAPENYQPLTSTLAGGHWNVIGGPVNPGRIVLRNASGIQINAAGITLAGEGRITGHTDDALIELATITPDGSVALREGASAATVGPLSNEGSVSVAGGSLLETAGPYTQTSGSTTLAGGLATGGRLKVLAGDATFQGGVLQGSGAVEATTIESGAVVRPDVPGGVQALLSARGGYRQLPAGRLEIDVGGEHGSERDVLFAAYGVALDGALAINTRAGYSPQVGDTFTVLEGESVSGQFSSLEGDQLAGDLYYRVEYLSTNVRLIVTSSETAPADTTAPDTTITGPSGTIGHDSPRFGFGSSELGSVFECRIDGAVFTACGTPYTAGPLRDGPHSFDVRAVDAAGNADPTPAGSRFTIDTTAPQTTITTGPTRTTADRTPTFTFASSENGSSFRCRVDLAAFAPCRSPRTLAVLRIGRHRLEVRATDPVGNTDASPATRSFIVTRRRARACAAFRGARRAACISRRCLRLTGPKWRRCVRRLTRRG